VAQMRAPPDFAFGTWAFCPPWDELAAASLCSKRTSCPLAEFSGA